MNAQLSPRTLLIESIPLAVVVAIWTGLSLVDASGTVGLALRVAGVALALAYAFVRSRDLAAAGDSLRLPRTPGAVAAANVTPLLAAAPWFIAATLITLPFRTLHRLRVVRYPDPLVETLRFWLAATGLLTVVFYAVVVVRADRPPRRGGERDDRASADAAVGDD